MRYEYNSVWEETNVRVSNFDYATQQILPPGIPFYQPDRNDFGPRLGFAYDPFGSGKTVIRGFGAIFYLPQLQGAVNSLPSNNFPNVEVNVFQDPTLAFPVPAVLPAMASVHDINALDPHLRDTYSEQWGLNVQRELLPQIVFTLGYTGNRRIVGYQALYACAMLLCVVNTYVSITVLILLQLNSALAPRIRPLDRF